jgi:hypothetical protein
MRGLGLCDDWGYVKMGYVRTGVMLGLGLCEGWGFVRTGIVSGMGCVSTEVV